MDDVSVPVEATYRSCLEKGTLLLHRLGLCEDDVIASLRTAGNHIGKPLASAFTKPEQLHEAGWTQSKLKFQIEGKPEMEAAFESLGISQALEQHKTTAWTWELQRLADKGVAPVLGSHQARYVPINGAMKDSRGLPIGSATMAGASVLSA